MKPRFYSGGFGPLLLNSTLDIGTGKMKYSKVVDPRLRFLAPNPVFPIAPTISGLLVLLHPLIVTVGDSTDLVYRCVDIKGTTDSRDVRLVTSLFTHSCLSLSQYTQVKSENRKGNLQ